MGKAGQKVLLIWYKSSQQTSAFCLLPSSMKVGSGENTTFMLCGKTCFIGTALQGSASHLQIIDLLNIVKLLPESI
jgi:hypothetical protein